MAFPDTPLGVMVELYIGGVWINITGDVYTNNLITITRGRMDEASRTDAGTCVFVLNNETGRYSARNPRSDLYGLIGRNTPVRVSIQPGGPSTARLVRFVGEVSSWPPKWSTARYVTVSASASGILRRLGQGATPLASPMRREFTNPARTSIVGYWPMEDGSTATEFASALPGGPPLTILAGSVKPAAYTGYAASDALPTLGDGKLTVTVPTYTAGQSALRFFAAFPDTAPSADVPLVELQALNGMRWALAWESSGVLSIRVFNKAGTSLEYITHGGAVTGKRLSIGLDLTQSGTTITRRLYFIDVDEYTLADGAPVTQISGTLTGYTFNRITKITVGGGSAGDVVLGHIALADATTAYGATGRAMIGYAGETALNRLVRLCREEDIPFTYQLVEGLSSTKVGAQSVAALLDLLQEAIDADGGRLYEQRDGLALAARTRVTLYTQTPALTLDYAAAEVADALDPVDDDQHVRNDVTIARRGGSSARAVAETGPLSVQAPPNGVGRYSGSTTLNLFSDEQCSPVAYWYLHVGTRDAPRYPSVSVEVHNAPDLIEQVATVDVGDRAIITNPPEWLPPEQIEMLVEGYTETLGVYTWDVTYNASPGGVFLVGMTDDAEYGIADTDGSQLAQAVTATTTQFLVKATDGPAWGSVDLPYRITCGGETMTVTSVAEYILNGNSDFESGIAGWAAFGGAMIAASTVQRVSGSGSLLLTTTGAASPRTEALKVAVTPGTAYRAAGWIRPEAALANGVSISVNWYSSTNAYISTSSNVRVPTVGEWKRWDATFTAPATAAWAGILLSVAGTPAAGIAVYGDVITLTPATPTGVFTVTRGTNGVALPHPAGAELSLAHTAFAAL
ncbi:carbohydrate binding domain-containing protein [Streptomyces sp. NBC_00124]|uniref:carbohydrate binding domain-containing protein n=1 Tax=Streptomyces sp. NBC_00124 TaxID=2975662 RepID=UPI00225370A3|nr:carbohydrate binding domain-containing protein [Streptomyces sp. NBC_00124]MCX5362872.1 carbohydrate binding domain-containing protein [Streptomyces sp. NBC_00124]